jgi:hypothetical protein
VEAEGTPRSRIGFIDRKGREIVPLQDIELTQERFSDGLIAFADGNRVGFMDRRGRVAIPPRFYFPPVGDGECGCSHEGGPAEPFSEGRAFVHEGRRSYFIDRTGNQAFPGEFDETRGGFKDGMAAVKVNGKWGLIDRSGNWMIKPRYQSVGRTSEGLWPVCHDEKSREWMYVDRSGQQAVKGTFSYAGEFSGGLAFVELLPEGAWSEIRTALVDRSGYVRRLDPSIVDEKPFREGLARVGYDETVNRKGGSASSPPSPFAPVFLDRNGAVAIRLRKAEQLSGPNGLMVDDFFHGLAHVWSKDTGETIGYIDPRGEFVWSRPGMDPPRDQPRQDRNARNASGVSDPRS